MLKIYNAVMDWFNDIWNFTKRPICAIKGHDMCLTMCMRCWQWFPNLGDK